MHLRTTAILTTATLGLTVAGIASAAELPIAPIGTGETTCVLKPGADCRGVVHRWTTPRQSAPGPSTQVFAPVPIVVETSASPEAGMASPRAAVARMAVVRGRMGSSLVW